MKKFIGLLFCICIIFASAGLAEVKPFANLHAPSPTHFSNPISKIGSWFKRLFVKKKKAACVNYSPSVTGLILSRPETGYYSNDQTYVTDTTGLLEVSTEAEDPENDTLLYYYDISGGRVIGQGRKVLWDLSDAEPGLHWITAWADDGCGRCGRTITLQVALNESDEPQKRILPCPGAGIRANVKSVTAGEMIAFHATFGNPADLARPLVWTVNSGEIVSGQNTDTLFVIATSPGKENEVKASFNFADEAAACEYSMWHGVKIIEP